MRLMLLTVGRMRQGPERDLLARYVERTQVLARNMGLQGFDLREVEEGRAATPTERMREEARALGTGLPSGAVVIALDERGRSLSSGDFAATLGRARDYNRPALALMIGGADGLDPSLREGAAMVVGYGAATFPHQLVRILAAEQIYRALTILSGHPYHRA